MYIFTQTHGNNFTPDTPHIPLRARKHLSFYFQFVFPRQQRISAIVASALRLSFHKTTQSVYFN